jgi:transposase
VSRQRPPPHCAQCRSCRAFLSDLKKAPVAFHFTPLHASWLNQIEIWFSVLLRKVIRRGNFRSQEDLAAQIHTLIHYFHEPMARPFRRPDRAKPRSA